MSRTGIVVRDLRIDVPSSGDVLVSDVWLSIAAGEITGLVGESGSGKTSIGLAMLGFARHGARLAAGSVSVDGDDLLAMSSEQLRNTRGRTVAYVAQDPAAALNPSMRIGAQLRELIDTHEPTCSPELAQERIERILDDVGLPGDPAFLKRYPYQLSGGQQQRICIAMAFLLDPRAVVLDEPTTGLDVVTQSKVIELVRRMCTEREVAALYISHDLAVVAQIADRVVVLYAGQVVEEGPRTTVLRRARHPYTSSLLRAVPDMHQRRLLAIVPSGTPSQRSCRGGCAFHPRCSMADDLCATRPPPLRELTGGHRVRCHHVDHTANLQSLAPTLPDLDAEPEMSPILTVANLRVAYGDHPVLTDVSFDLAPAECLAVVGESGSGKTTLSRTLAGLIIPAAGTVHLAGVPLPAGVRNRSRETRRTIQYVFQNPYASLNPRKTIEQILIKPLRVFRSLDRSAARHEAACALERVGLRTSMLQRYPHELSGGERQRIAVARALACEPQVLICDEVTSALDVSAQASIVEMLRGLVDHLGLALLFVTHDLALVRTIAERTAVVNAGRIVEIGDTAQLISAPQHPYTRTLVRTSPSLTDTSSNTGATGRTDHDIS